MPSAILEWQIVDGPVVWVSVGLALAFALYLLIRKPSARWVATAIIGILGGGVIGAATVLVVDLTRAAGVPLSMTVNLWIIVVFAGLGLAAVNLWRSRWWRKVLAVVGAGAFVLVAVLGINASFGLDKTVGAFLGISTGKQVALPTHEAGSLEYLYPLYKSWKPPADMPKVGTVGTQVIPNTLSGFNARPASIYLPPAALVKGGPRLPFMLLMMGQPGNPDPSFVANVLNADAAKNNGLAPIVVVADQLGDPDNDPACADSAKFGKAQTYITQDVVDWAKKNLHITQDPKYWTLAGYSNGGGCAFKYVAQSPTQWGNLLDLSGELYPGSEIPDQTIQDVFGGNAAAFNAAKPTAIMAAHPGAYSKITAIFTTGSNDPAFGPAAQQSADAARAAGMQVTYAVIPGADHVGGAIDGGLAKGFEVLYPKLGLSAP